MTTHQLSLRERSYKVLDNLTVGIRVEENPYSLPIDSIFQMAARNNPNRSFLFVSKLIGKHIPVNPQVPFITGYLLASRLAETMGLPVNKTNVQQAAKNLAHNIKNIPKFSTYQFPGKAIFIGFAETATALGHCVFNYFDGDINFAHTTREPLEGSCDTIYFTEDHCHAPDQRLLVEDSSIIKDNDLLVLIDDEITTGNTCLNIIKMLQKKYPQKRYAILTIIDWRNEDSSLKYQEVERKLGVKIDVISLLKGTFWHQGTSPVITTPLAVVEAEIPSVRMVQESLGNIVKNYLKFTGRFGVSSGETKEILETAKKTGIRLTQFRKGNKTLCLGTGEFMYLPFLVANFMGDVKVQSTTRSPVHPHLTEGYAIKHAITFEDPFRPGVKNFIYNIPPNHYDEVFVFWERKVLPEQVAPLVQGFARLGIKNIIFIYNCCLK